MEIRAGIPRLSYRKFYGIRGCDGGGSKGTLKLCEDIEFRCWGISLGRGSTVFIRFLERPVVSKRLRKLARIN